jgi:hypothetical protein
MFLKRKLCAVGRPQRAFIPSEDAMSHLFQHRLFFLPVFLMHMKCGMLLPLIYQELYASGFGQPRLTGRIVDILLGVEKAAYAPYVTYEGKEKVLYVELLKALSATLKAARLFWLQLSGKLHGYDSCVAN